MVQYRYSTSTGVVQPECIANEAPARKQCSTSTRWEPVEYQSKPYVGPVRHQCSANAVQAYPECSISTVPLLCRNHGGPVQYQYSTCNTNVAPVRGTNAVAVMWQGHTSAEPLWYTCSADVGPVRRQCSASAAPADHPCSTNVMPVQLVWSQCSPGDVSMNPVPHPTGDDKDPKLVDSLLASRPGKLAPPTPASHAQPLEKGTVTIATLPYTHKYIPT